MGAGRVAQVAMDARQLRATVLADSQVLLSAKNTVRRPAGSEDADPVMLAFLQFVEKQMTEPPDLIEPADRSQPERISKLIDDDATH